MYRIPVKRLCISDVHLGGGFTRVDGLLRLLDRYEFKELVLCGDILDFWRMKNRVNWDVKSYTRLVDKIFEIAKTKRVIYIPGNHDEWLRQFDGRVFLGLFIKNEYIRDDILFIHGDQFDSLATDKQVIYHVGDFFYILLQKTNRLLRWPLSFVLKNPFIISKGIKAVAKRIFGYLNGFYDNAANYAKIRNVGKIVCGHTHIAEKRFLDGCIYYNCGDWVESGTAVIQYSTGELEVIDIDVQDSPEKYWQSKGIH